MANKEKVNCEDCHYYFNFEGVVGCVATNETMCCRDLKKINKEGKCYFYKKKEKENG